MPTGDYFGTLSSFKHLHNILFSSSSHEPVYGCLWFCLTSIQSGFFQKRLHRDVIMCQFGCWFCTFARSATLLLTCWGSAGFFTGQIWKRATAASTGDTRDAFWKPSECELLCHYTNAWGRTSKWRVEAGGGSRLQCFMCVFYGSLSVRQHALAAESRFLKADLLIRWDFSCWFFFFFFLLVRQLHWHICATDCFHADALLTAGLLGSAHKMKHIKCDGAILLAWLCVWFGGRCGKVWNW